MALVNFYEIESFEKVGNKLQSSIRINPDHSIYEGHFPNNPITPGVVQIQIVKELLEKHFGTELKMKELGRCKFTSILNPNVQNTINIDIEILSDDSPIKVKAEGKDDEITYLKFNAHYEKS